MKVKTRRDGFFWCARPGYAGATGYLFFISMNLANCEWRAADLGRSGSTCRAPEQEKQDTREDDGTDPFFSGLSHSLY